MFLVGVILNLLEHFPSSVRNSFVVHHRVCFVLSAFEPPHDKTNKVACAPSKDSNQPKHPPSLIRVFAVRSVGS